MINVQALKAHSNIHGDKYDKRKGATYAVPDETALAPLLAAKLVKRADGKA